MSPTSSALSSSHSSRSRSILSRLASPLASKTRNLSEFYIRPDQPHRQYAPGDVVKGAVVLTVIKPVRVTHLVVRLHGHVRVFNTANAPSDGISCDSGLVGTGRGRRGSEYLKNGHVALFEDEITLCGEGRLDVGCYQFNFELDFPSKGVPSSIDFERGTISYLITSTLTRPTTIAPTSSCDQKIYLVETVDVAPLSHSKQRVITLNPISREKKVKTRDSKRPSARPAVSRASTDRSGSVESVPRWEAQPLEGTLHSPALSEVSSQSVASTSSRSSRIGGMKSSNHGGDGQGVATAHADKTITATIELLRAGCLPGDVLPVLISINHTKAIKSLEGIIITLYRQGRIDTNPAILPDPTGKGKSAVRSGCDYYPKSKTGLGSLSLSSAGSSSVFRKDLSQTFAPLIVDPRSLTAVVKTSVRVPEDAFPTISSVPGAMISFKYYVEIIVDLRGKLAAAKDSFLPRLARSSVLNGSQHSSHILQRDETGTTEVVSSFSGNILDTDQIRREKSVAASLFEVVVGTRDSGRKRATRGPRTQQAEYHESFAPAQSTDVRLPDGPEDYQPGEAHIGPHCLLPSNGTGQLGEYFPPHHQIPLPPAGAVPSPIVEDEDAMDEKTRIRRAEVRLLPSQPPAELVFSPHAEHNPTAPGPLDDLGMDGTGHMFHYAEASIHAYGHDGPSAPSAESIVPTSRLQENRRREPELPVELPRSSPGDDKQELERRRLQLEASAPEGFPDDDDVGTAEANAGESGLADLEPSAPVLPEEEQYTQQGTDQFYQGSDSGIHSSTRESLPRYER